MNETMQNICSRYAAVVPAEIHTAAMEAADAACAQLQAIHDTVPAAEQVPQVKEVLSAVSGLKKALMQKAQQFHDDLNPNVLFAFHDLCSQQVSGIHGMMHIVGNKVVELFPNSEDLAKLADTAKSDGDTMTFPSHMVKEGDKYVVELTHIHDGKSMDENPAAQKEVKSFRFHIVQKDGKYIVEQG